MDSLYQIQSVLIGLIGWAATIVVSLSASRLTVNDRRMLAVCSWMLWMIPAIGALVYRGLLTTDTAALYVGATTLFVGLIVLLTAAATREHTRP
jgi:uncharacterized membrane protein